MAAAAAAAATVQVQFLYEGGKAGIALLNCQNVNILLPGA